MLLKLATTASPGIVAETGKTKHEESRERY